MRIQFGKKEGINLFRLEPLTPSVFLSSFSCSIEEYTEYLYNDALCSQNDHIARTWLLRERATGKITAYMSLIMDALKRQVQRGHDNGRYKTIFYRKRTS